MGAYTYLLRSPVLARKARVQRADGSSEIIRVAALGFSHKISWSNGDPRWFKSVEANLKRAWDADEPVKFAAVADRLDKHLRVLPSSKRFKLAPGLVVLHWPDRERVPSSMTDCSYGGAVRYGTIIELLD